MNLRGAIDEILLDMDLNMGEFDDSLMKDEKRDLAARLILDAIADADYGPRPSAG